MNCSLYFIKFKKQIQTAVSVILLVIILMTSFKYKCIAQTTVVKDSLSIPGTTVVIPGKSYVRSNFHNLFFGRHYRKEWGTAIRVNRFLLDTALGGLQPVKESGSRQSNGLRLKSKTGKEFVLRSIDKDFGNGFPEIYKGTFISKIAKDQVSFGYPLAAITITPMISAAKIYHTNPKIVFVPKQQTLGEFNLKYGDQLYLFEERPDDNQYDAAWFGNSEKVISTEKLLEKIFDDNDNSVDQFAYAKARLFDMLIGDWGRHADQWRWASFKKEGKTIYKPIPRDRDQAYTKFDGFFPFIATNIIGGTHLESFDNDIKNISFFNKPARQLDIQFTNGLTEADWIKAAIELQQAITDSVIIAGIKNLPHQLYIINGPKITNLLIARRGHLQDFAHRYYKYLSKKLPVYGSDDKELFDIVRINKNETSINVYKIKKDGSTAAIPHFSRLIFEKETKELRLYGFKGSDIFKVSGLGNNTVKIRLVGVSKSDSLSIDTDKSDKKFKIYRGKAELYDTIYQPQVKISPIVFVSPSVYHVFDEDALALFTKPGLHLGLNLAYHPEPLKKDSLEQVHNIALNYGFLRKTLYAEYVGLFPQLIGKWDFLLKGKIDNPASENYFGIGNESKDSTGAANNYYSVFSKRYYAGIGLTREIKKFHKTNFTLFYQNISVNKNAESYIHIKESMLPVFLEQQYFGAEAGYRYHKTNNDLIATKGISLSAGAGYITNATARGKSFFKAMSSIAFYIPVSNVISFAVRAGGAAISGDANYYHLGKLGGNVNLRGYARERFYGKTSFYNNNEIRLITNTRNFIFNGKVGVFGFFDNGRVWYPAEISNKWHFGYGGGILLSPFNKVMLTATYGISEEGTQILFKAGMFF